MCLSILMLPSIILLLTITILILSKELLPAKTMSSIISCTPIGSKPLTCIYKATSDGWSHKDFHKYVDYNPPVPSLVVLKKTKGAISGAYNAAGCQSRDDYVASRKNFMWRFTNGKSGDVERATTRSDAALYDFGDRALWFNEALDVPFNPKYSTRTRSASSGLSATYSSFPGGKGSLFDQGSAELAEIEIWAPEEYVTSFENAYKK